jgi:hypothetical protein
MLVFTVVNSSFGVLMEGPVLGVWFWFALGFALGRSHAYVASPFIQALGLKTPNALKQPRGFATA